MTDTKSLFQRILNRERNKKQRKKPDDREHRLQTACVQWFRYQYPQLAPLLFAVPNGGQRNPKTAARLKEEGVTPGVADLILLHPNSQHGALLIEMKTETGRQQATQKQWQQAVERLGYQYTVCHSIDEFTDTIHEYFSHLL